MNGMRLVLFDMNNRIYGPYLAAIHRILISVMLHARTQVYPWVDAGARGIAVLYRLLYLSYLTPHYTPLLHLLGHTLVRVPDAELVGQCRTPRCGSPA
jgi:Pex2 / Pex12 amino terminal region